MTPGILLALALSACAAPPPPSVVWIMLDAARPDHVSAYSYAKPTTPNLDAAAREGALFLNAFSPYSYTLMAVPAILSSRRLTVEMINPSQARMLETRESAFRWLDDEQVFLPEALSRAGYTTALFTDHPALAYDNAVTRSFQEVRLTPVQKDPSLFSAAAEWIRGRAGGPFFLYLHAISPHEPYLPTSHDARFLGEFDSESVAAMRRRLWHRKFDRTTGWSAGELAILRGLYDSNLAAVDEAMAPLLAAVRRENDSSRPILLVVTSDHGENLGEHGRLGHGTLWDTALKVPLLISLPKVIPPDLLVEAPLDTIDLAPTVLDLCGVGLPPGKALDGSSLRPRLRRDARPLEPLVSAGVIRTRTHKHIPEWGRLFDWRSDPGETRDLASREPALRRRLTDEHARLMAPHERRLRSGRRRSPPPYAFDYHVDQFDISPATAPGGPWRLEPSKRPRLTRLPRPAGPAALILATRVPPGEYGVTVDVDLSGAKPATPPRLKILPPGKRDWSLLEPAVTFRDDKRDETVYTYDVGVLRSRGEDFSLAVDLEPLPDREPALTRITFSPPQRPWYREDDEAAKRKSLNEKLRAAGYLR